MRLSTFITNSTMEYEVKLLRYFKNMIISHVRYYLTLMKNRFLELIRYRKIRDLESNVVFATYLTSNTLKLMDDIDKVKKFYAVTTYQNGLKYRIITYGSVLDIISLCNASNPNIDRTFFSEIINLTVDFDERKLGITDLRGWNSNLCLYHNPNCTDFPQTLDLIRAGVYNHLLSNLNELQVPFQDPVRMNGFRLNVTTLDDIF